MGRMSALARTGLNRVLSRRGLQLVVRGDTADIRWGLSQPDGRIMETAAPFSMTGPDRMAGLIASVAYCINSQIPGDLVECGVWRGGSAMAMLMKLRSLNVTDRDIWLYDTFQGMPAPDPVDRVARSGESAAELMASTPIGAGDNVWAFSSIEDVRRNLDSCAYPAERIRLVRGDVAATLPEQAPERICLLRLDTDFYQSTFHELTCLYDRVSPGGIVIIDDYGYWEGARAAVDEFFAQRGERPLMVPLDDTGRLIMKTASP